MAITKLGVIDLYRKRAASYDLTANLYYLIGFTFHRYRRLAVDTLFLQPGDTVVDIACGTGLNFPLLQERVGPRGCIIGVDITDGMLAQARRRIEKNGWQNVKLVNCDASEFRFPPCINGILSTFGLTLIPEFDQIIASGHEALVPCGRFTILDFKEPDNRPRWMTHALVRLTKPFGVTLDLADRHPWESLERDFLSASMEDLYLGYTYIAVGKKQALLPTGLNQDLF